MPTLQVTPIFKGRVIELSIERAQLPNGGVIDLEVVRHPGGAAIAALDARGRVCLLRQFRHTFGDWLWELPAGKIDHGEPPLTTATRELREEAGVTAARWQSLGDYISSPGTFTEVVHLFLARDLTHGATELDEHEVLEVHWKPLAEVVAMAQKGVLRDGKSVVGILRAAACVSD